MSALFSAIDSLSSYKVGENKHPELDWSKKMEEKIVQFDFQCVRTDAEGVSKLSVVLDELLKELTASTNDSKKELLVSLYKIIGKTRDINCGKGEYSLSYMMLLTWCKYYPKLALYAFQTFVIDPKDIDASMPSQEPYGSWKDMKYFCKYILDNGGTMDHEFIKNCIKGININLRLDDFTYSASPDAEAKKNLTLASKWVPRESSKKFGFLYDALAMDYFPQYMASANYVPMVHRESTRKKALDKCRAQYRMLCSKLNRHLDTVQIKQTAKNWASINHAKTTSITMAKQRKAFLNKKGSEDPDRIECANNLRAYLENLKKEGKEVKGKNLSLPDFTKQAQALAQWKHNIVCSGYYVPKTEESDILNSQWRDNSIKKNANGLGPVVPMCDLSGSMSGDPMAAAIALSCRVAEKSVLGRCVMTFSAEPAWIDLDGKVDFTDMAMEILSHSRTAGFNTDFYKALDLILATIEKYRVPPADVENMILAIFSDMQIDDNLCYKPGSNSYTHSEEDTLAARSKWGTMHERIREKYATVGMRMYGKPLNPPHILFWNLRNTNGFPSMTTEAGCSMMSGFDPTVLNMFCEMGIDALKDMTPYKNLMKLLENERYLPLEKAIREHLNMVAM
jgi:hypothetical protein